MCIYCPMILYVTSVIWYRKLSRWTEARRRAVTVLHFRWDAERADLITERTLCAGDIDKCDFWFARGWLHYAVDSLHRSISVSVSIWWLMPVALTRHQITPPTLSVNIKSQFSYRQHLVPSSLRLLACTAAAGPRYQHRSRYQSILCRSTACSPSLRVTFYVSRLSHTSAANYTHVDIRGHRRVLSAAWRGGIMTIFIHREWCKVMVRTSN